MYRIGLDIGIGSVGWAVVANDGQTSYIEDFGVRIFESGENIQAKKTFCQERRGFRGVRRLVRRRLHRKLLLKNLLDANHMLPATFNDEYEDLKDEDVFTLKVKGLTDKLTVTELYKCLIHTCNHRGYRDFYESDDADGGKEDKSDEGKNKTAVKKFSACYEAEGAASVSAYLVARKEGKFVSFRNRQGGTNEFQLINRKFLREETEKILACQSRFYPALNATLQKQIVGVIFDQRMFEDGPGQQGEKDAKYTGFLETLGQCTFYPDEKRGFKCTVISDVYAVVNTLSQYRYYDEKTGEIGLPKETAEEIIESLLHNANLTQTDVKKILARYGKKMQVPPKAKSDALQKSIRFIGSAKKAVLSVGKDWDSFIGEEQFELSKPSLLHRIGELVSQYQTPRYRREKLGALLGKDPALVAAFAGRKFSGTARVSYRYMLDSIEAFLNGEVYGNFQARFNEESALVSDIVKTVKLSPACIDDEDVRKNRVVFKAINETRKIVNAIIDAYGSPNEIVIEVADELGMGFSARAIEASRQNKLEKENDATEEKVAKLIGAEKGDATTNSAVLKYRLYEQQNGRCPYCGKPLGEETWVLKEGKGVEIDHIVPFSLILDNTMNNKVLVHTECNQYKAQRTPMEYLSVNPEKLASYKAFVNEMYSRKESPISKKKYEYLTCPSVSFAATEGLLDAWKSRNINDTRYITKYVVAMFKKYLRFAEGEYGKSEHVIAVKGVLTSRFRQTWLRDLVPWGDEKKAREFYLNHACDAVILANLTRPYIEIGSYAIRLRYLFKHAKEEYEPFKDDCIERMKEYFGFREDYTERLLRDPERIPSYVPDLKGEIQARFEDDEEKFAENVKKFYRGRVRFICPPHAPLVSFKQNRKFVGAVADSNYVRVEKVDGQPRKIKRKSVKGLTEKDLLNLFGGNEDLSVSLHSVLDGKGEKYTVENYLAEQGLTAFYTLKGQPVRMVSLDAGPISEKSFYSVDKGNGNVNHLGGMKYYTVEIYRNEKGELGLYGIRFVDMVKKNGKLYQRPESRPADYAEHVTYLFAGDYMSVRDKNGKLKYEGYYKSVFNINIGQLYVAVNPNQKGNKNKGFARSDTVELYSVSILGRKGEKPVRCSAPYPLLPEKK